MNIKTNLKKVACGVLSAAMLLTVAPKFSFADNDLKCNLGIEKKFSDLEVGDTINTEKIIGKGTNKYIGKENPVNVANAGVLPSKTAGSEWIEYDGTKFYCDNVEVTPSNTTPASNDYVLDKNDNTKLYSGTGAAWGAASTAIGESAVPAQNGKVLEATVNTVNDDMFFIKTATDTYKSYKMASTPKDLKGVQVYCDSTKVRVDLQKAGYTVTPFYMDDNNDMQTTDAQPTVANGLTEANIKKTVGSKEIEAQYIMIQDTNNNVVYTNTIAALKNDKNNLYHPIRDMAFEIYLTGVSLEKTKGNNWDYNATIGKDGETKSVCIEACYMCDSEDKQIASDTFYRKDKYNDYACNTDLKFEYGDYNNNSGKFTPNSKYANLVKLGIVSSNDGSTFYTISVDPNAEITEDQDIYVKITDNGITGVKDLKDVPAKGYSKILKLTLKPSYTAPAMPGMPDGEKPENPDAENPENPENPDAQNPEAPEAPEAPDAQAPDATDANGNVVTAENKKTGDEMTMVFSALGVMVLAAGAIIAAKKKNGFEA